MFRIGVEENGFEDCERRMYREGSTRPVKNMGDTLIPVKYDVEKQIEKWEDKIEPYITTRYVSFIMGSNKSSLFGVKRCLFLNGFRLI